MGEVLEWLESVVDTGLHQVLMKYIEVGEQWVTVEEEKQVPESQLDAADRFGALVVFQSHTSF